jgi:hypothetical protein
MNLALHRFDWTMTATDDHANSLAIDRVEIDVGVFKRQLRSDERKLRSFIKPARVVLAEVQ